MPNIAQIAFLCHHLCQTENVICWCIFCLYSIYGRDWWRSRDAVLCAVCSSVNAVIWLWMLQIVVASQAVKTLMKLSAA